MSAKSHNFLQQRQDILGSSLKDWLWFCFQISVMSRSLFSRSRPLTYNLEREIWTTVRPGVFATPCSDTDQFARVVVSSILDEGRHWPLDSRKQERIRCLTQGLAAVVGHTLVVTATLAVVIKETIGVLLLRGLTLLRT